MLLGVWLGHPHDPFIPTLHTFRRLFMHLNGYILLFYNLFSLSHSTLCSFLLCVCFVYV